MAGASGDGTDLSPNIRENFNPRKKWANAVRVIAATRKFRKAGSGANTPLDSDESDGGFKTAESDDEDAPSSGGLAGVAAALKAKTPTDVAEQGIQSLDIK
jgi:hypothetical protein